MKEQQVAAKIYEDQVQLLVAALPFVAQQACFALKGGTAINLFYRDLPRLSVDIDLTYLPVKDRAESLADINAALGRIADAIEAHIPRTRAHRIQGGGGGETRILLRQGPTEIKVETSPVTRGVVNEPRQMRVMETVEDRFGFAEMPVLAFEDLFAGKMHAALDRQHPRDLFDIKLLYENEGLTDALFRTFLVYVASSPRPPHELLRPTRVPFEELFTKEFEGMTRDAIRLDDLAAARERLIADIGARLDESVQRFLLSLHDAEPDFSAIGLNDAGALPAVRWKVQNLARLKQDNPEKHAEQRALLDTLFQQS
jgi:hypothetical protein